MQRNQYEGKTLYEGKEYRFCAIVDRPNEITTLTIEGGDLEQGVIGHGLIFSKPVNWSDRKEREEFLDRVVKNHIYLDKNVISKLHAETVAEYNREAI